MVSPTDKGVEARKLQVFETGRPDAHFWRDLWRYRDLSRFLAWRDVSALDKQATGGIECVVLRP